MMSGFLPERSASAPQNGRKGRPTTADTDVMAPTQKATWLCSIPRSGKWSGVNAVTCPTVQTSHNPASEKRMTIRRQPELERPRPDGVWTRICGCSVEEGPADALDGGGADNGYDHGALRFVEGDDRAAQSAFDRADHRLGGLRWQFADQAEGRINGKECFAHGCQLGCGGVC